MLVKPSSCRFRNMAAARGRVEKSEVFKSTFLKNKRMILRQCDYYTIYANSLLVGGKEDRRRGQVSAALPHCAGLGQ